MSKDEFGRQVEHALSELPSTFAEYLERVPIEVRDRPTPRQLREVGLAENDLLLGLYVGTSLPNESVLAGVEMPAVIYLFQKDIEEACHSVEQLRQEIRKTVLHEIGHHFGLDEADLDELGYG